MKKEGERRGRGEGADKDQGARRQASRRARSPGWTAADCLLLSLLKTLNPKPGMTAAKCLLLSASASLTRET